MTIFLVISLWPRGILIFKLTRLRGYKKFSMVNSAEHEIYPATKC